MDLDLLKTFTERLRAESIGDPEWVESKGVFEYPKQSIEVVTVLKLIRAAQGIHALDLLCRAGLFVDMGAIYRCVGDCTSEVYFLLENYPKKSSNVQKFLKEFFSKTIDGYLSSEELPVPTKKIHNAVVRSITGSKQDERIKKSLINVYQTFCGYIHAGYGHIMEMFGGRYPGSFNISGIPSQEQKDKRMQLVIEAYKSVLYAIAHAAHKFGLIKLYADVMQYCKQMDDGL
jgi:hypothetical protein